MADKKISELVELTEASAEDLLAVVDVSGAETKKITLQNLQDSPIAAISASITATAVDVFVYDTRKDSDGGAWRKRTQHTSWYNETLNTATRGARREFPAVAVIVAESNKVTIYDGDDPAMPMWMVFNYKGLPASLIRASANRSIDALNGIVAMGVASATEGLEPIDFVSDKALRIRNSADAGSNTTSISKGLVDRNSDTFFVLTSTAFNLVNSTVNDVAMTVLPNAPIDAATGLPIPTIAVATNGGVSVIKDDGTVVSKSNLAGITPYCGSVAFMKDNDTVAVEFGFSSTANYTRVQCLSLSGGLSITDGYYVAGTDYAGYYGASSNWVQKLVSGSEDIGVEEGLLRIDNINGANVNEHLLAHVTSTYNTGWLPGDIKGAWLSDTDATNVTGAELVTNGTFDTDTDWTKEDGWTIGSGVASYSAATGRNLYTSFSTVAGKKYTISFDVVSATTGGFGVYITSGSTDASSVDVYNTTTGTFSRTFTASGSVATIAVRTSTTSAVGSVDNISVRLADADRSVNNNGLQVFGTVTKSPVATGADLVAYSGFSASNYLQQPYNSDLDFGTGDFCVMGWFNYGTSSDFQIFADRQVIDAAANRIYFGLDASQKLYVYTKGATTIVSGSSANAVPLSSWSFATMIRKNGTLYGYVNGNLVVTATGASQDVTSNAPFRIGHICSDIGTDIPNGSLALWRISATAPTAAQIAKIYEDEKVLFQDGAQATLYGASDAVTALAYDEDTNLLHVGTSAGRSDFQGLRRVNNTTTAVGVALSASNGMIVEE